MPVHGITIRLDRARNVYHQGEHVTGRLVLDNKYELRHEGVLVSLEGFVDINANFKRINLLLDSFNGTARTLPLVEITYELVKPGRLLPGKTIVPLVSKGFPPLWRDPRRQENTSYTRATQGAGAADLKC